MSNSSVESKYKWLLLLVVLCLIVFSVGIGLGFYNMKINHADRVRAANLVVYTHSSFIDAYGPGAEIKAEFEKTCDCTVEYVDAGGAQVAIEKMKLDPTRRVDVIMGLDLLLLARAANSIRVQDISRPDVKWSADILPFVYARFVPYDWSPMGFIYDKNKIKPAQSLAEAIENLPQRSVALQDPTMSAPGLNMLYWLFSIANGTNSFEALTKRINRVAHSYSPSWSTAYGLFRKYQAPVVFSYLTSLAYHLQAEKNSNYDFMIFSEGHPMQIEYAAVPDTCWNCAVAKKFVTFLVSPFSQKLLAEKNYMLPVVERVPLPAVYSRLPAVKSIGHGKLEEFAIKTKEILAIWGDHRK